MTTRAIRLGGALLIAALVATGAMAEPIAASMTIERKVVVDWAAIAEHGDWNLCGDAQGRIIYCGGAAVPQMTVFSHDFVKGASGLGVGRARVGHPRGQPSRRTASTRCRATR